MARRLSRDRFRELFAESWRDDQHVSLIGPTGRGKSYTARQLLERRAGRSLIMQPKGPDKTMSGLGHKITRWPPGPFTPRPDNGRWLLRLEPPLKRADDVAKMPATFRKALDHVFRQGRWTVYVDELQLLSDPRMMGLGKQIEQLLILGRSRQISVVSSIQVPRWAPKAAYDQAAHVLMWRQRDRPALKRISEISGVDSAEVEALVRSLDFHEFVWVDAVTDRYYVVAAH